MNQPVTQKRLGRPVAHGPVTLVSIDNKVLQHVDGHLHGNQTLVVRAWLAIQSGTLCKIHPLGEPIQSSLSTDLGVVAALVAAAPGRAVIVQAPASVWEYLEEEENRYV